MQPTSGCALDDLIADLLRGGAVEAAHLGLCFACAVEEAVFVTGIELFFACSNISSIVSPSAAASRSMRFLEEFFDAAWCNDSFHHYADPDRAAFSVWRALRPGGAFVVGDVWQPVPARALINAWMPNSREGDVRIYAEGEMRAILGKWFDAVDWRRVGQTACVCVARKGRQGA